MGVLYIFRETEEAFINGAGKLCNPLPFAAATVDMRAHAPVADGKAAVAATKRGQQLEMDEWLVIRWGRKRNRGREEWWMASEMWLLLMWADMKIITRAPRQPRELPAIPCRSDHPAHQTTPAHGCMPTERSLHVQARPELKAAL